jgi:hypothetical protein
MREAAVGGVLVPGEEEDCMVGVTLFSILFFFILACHFGGVFPPDKER